MLQVEHADADLSRMETDSAFTAGFEVRIAKKFRYTLQQIRIVTRRNQLYQYNGMRLKKLERPGGQHAIWLNDQWRLIVEFSGEEPNERILIVGIENHYGD